MKNGKAWKLKAANNGKVLEFYPVFDIQGSGPMTEVEAKEVILKIGKDEYKINFTNLFQFVYFIANEELRQGLALRYDRKVNYLPYDVSFKLDDQEVQQKFARRRINLPVDEIITAYARNEAWKLVPVALRKIETGTRPQDLFKKGR